MTRTSRRTFLGAATCALLHRPAVSAATDSELVFDVYRDDEPIGVHGLSFHREGDDLVVDITIDLEVVFAWVTVFRYTHQNREVWRDGRLQRLDSATHDDGTDHIVSIRREADELVIDADGTRNVAPGHLLTTGYWHPGTPEQSMLVGTQKGRILKIAYRAQGSETITVAGAPAEARRFDVSGDLRMTMWYGADGLWNGMAFDARGSDIDYRVRTRPDDMAWNAIVAQTTI
ncbi:MAG: hypothetical protein GDA49_13995 [Rhodospirillales bacterium]|nr:hypothetical protein [Rhodospirillales bacterium]